MNVFIIRIGFSERPPLSIATNSPGPGECNSVSFDLKSSSNLCFIFVVVVSTDEAKEIVGEGPKVYPNLLKLMKDLYQNSFFFFLLFKVENGCEITKEK